MLIWLSTLVFALCFRIWAKTGERKMADAFTLAIYSGKNDKAITLASSLIARPTPTHELEHEIVDTLPPFSFIIKFIYSVFAYSLATVDERTPHSLSLWDSEQQLYELHDPDVFDAYREWKVAFFWDGVSAGVLTLVILSLFSRTIFTTLYR